MLKNNELSFIDLYLDLIQVKDKEWEVIDKEEFESNSIKYQYPSELKNTAVKALERLKEEVTRNRFPFN